MGRLLARKILMFTLVLSVLGGACGVLQAQTVNEEGVFTSKPWHDRYYYIEFNKIPYMFMPEIQVDAKFTGYQEQKTSPELLRNFQVGDRAIISKQGFRIYRVKFLRK